MRVLGWELAERLKTPVICSILAWPAEDRDVCLLIVGTGDATEAGVAKSIRSGLLKVDEDDELEGQDKVDGVDVMTLWA